MNSIPVQSIVVREPASLPGNEGAGAKRTYDYSATPRLLTRVQKG